MSNYTDRRAVSGMEEVRIPRAILEGLREQLSMLQNTLERLTEQNRQKDERIEELTQIRCC